jgi:uncharacterized lipoprotein YehR (DUF1307 family)
MRYYILAFIAIVALSSCKKDPGKGGSSTINGTVITVEYSKYNKQIVR